MANEPKTIDAAIEWLAKAQQLGFYKPNVARLIRAGAEAVKGVLAPDEDRTIERIGRDLEAIHVRLLNKSSGITRATAATYVARAKRLITDYGGWLEDPRNYMPTVRRGRGPGRPKASSEADAFEEPSFPFMEEAQQRSTKAETPGTTHRDHVLSLSTGKAYLRIPASISPEDVALLILIIKSHGPPPSPATTT